MKKELLWALRDYSFAQAWLEYGEYAEGILRGCDARVEGNRIVVSPGIVKYGGFLYMMGEEESIEYGVCDEFTTVRMCFHTEQVSQDYVRYAMELVSGGDEFEVCRYKLQKGAALRDKHIDFEDLNTEYNTLNFVHAAWGGIGGRTMSPLVTGCFAREILKSNDSRPEDIQFAYLCLDRAGAVPIEILRDYMARRGGKIGEKFSGEEVFREMCGVISRLNGTAKRNRQDRGRRMMIVE